MLKPLRQFYCDTCGELIEDPEHGYVEWDHTNDDDTHRDFGWRIVHHKLHSPRSGTQGCYLNLPASVALNRFLGPEGQARILAFFDIGEHLNTSGTRIRITDQHMREFIEFVRRVSLPYYEEARRYWRKAEKDGFFDGANEHWPYTPDHLKRLIEQYSGSEPSL